jgi:hypothetical protein
VPSQWITIKIPAPAYDAAVELRQRLRAEGLDALPDDLRDVAVDENSRGVGIGTVVSLGLVALRDVLDASSTRPRNRRKAKRSRTR